MSDKLYFMNDGFFDVRAMLTFGISAKSNPTAIGFFGTGFKYAIAIILRLGGTIKIITRTDDGVDEISNFTKVTATISGKDFEVVQRNGIDAGFTTHLGVQWEPWMAYRELRCNCTDERGVIGLELDMDYQTIIAVDCQQILSAHCNSGNYFIQGQPIHKTKEVEIFEGPRPFYYYRGVAVQNIKEDSIFSYNVTSPVDLSEERIARYSWQIPSKVTAAIQSMQDATIVRRLLRSGGDGDKKMQFSNTNDVSAEFREEAYQALKSGTLKNETARVLLETLVQQKAEYETKKLSESEMIMLGRAIRFLLLLDINVRDYPICPVISLGQNIMGRALNGKIYISEQAFMMGTKQVASTLMEEWMHLRHECDDFSRTMQNWLYDKILTLGENFRRSPL